MVDFRAARRAMVDGQVRTNGVTNLDLIEAMLDVPREAFVPERLAALAYLDLDLSLPAGDGATPAVQITVLLPMRSPATITPSSSM